MVVQLTEWITDIGRFEKAGRNLVNKRREEVVVVSVDQGNLKALIFS